MTERIHFIAKEEDDKEEKSSNRVFKTLKQEVKTSCKQK
jgi:uridine phosphorylase